jgi:hypothetical protein
MLYEPGIFSVAGYLPEGQPASLPIHAQGQRADDASLGG